MATRNGSKYFRLIPLHVMLPFLIFIQHGDLILLFKYFDLFEFRWHVYWHPTFIWFTFKRWNWWDLSICLHTCPTFRLIQSLMMCNANTVDSTKSELYIIVFKWIEWLSRAFSQIIFGWTCYVWSAIGMTVGILEEMNEQKGKSQMSISFEENKYMEKKQQIKQMHNIKK